MFRLTRLQPESNAMCLIRPPRNIIRHAVVTSVASLFALFSAMASSSIITYDISFTASSGPLPTSASFDFDDTIPVFSNFVVVWEFQTFDLTISANTGASMSPLSPYLGSCGLGALGAQLSFLILSHDTCVTSSERSRSWDVSSNPSAVSPFTFQSTSTVGNQIVALPSLVVLPLPTAASVGFDWGVTPRAAPPPPSPVPAPPTLSLFGAALIAYGISWRVRRNPRRST